MDRFQVLLLDDDDRHAQTLCARLVRDGYAARRLASADECHRHVRDAGDGCLVLDASFRGRSTLETFAAVMAAEPAFPVIFLVSQGDVRTCAEVMRHGAVDYLVEPAAPEELRAALVRAHARSRALHAVRADRGAMRERVSRLTPREREVLGLVIAGRRNKQIAAELSSQESTVKVHRSRLMRKLETRSLADLLRLAPHVGEALRLPQQAVGAHRESAGFGQRTS